MNGSKTQMFIELSMHQKQTGDRQYSCPIKRHELSENI